MHIKGIIFLGVKEYLQRKYGEEHWQKVLSKMSEDSRKIVDDPYLLPSKNYPVRLYRDLCVAIEKSFGKECDVIFEGIGEYSAKKVLLEMYKPLFNSNKNEPKKMFNLITNAISHVSPEKWVTKELSERKWTIKCSSEIFKDYFDMIEPVCKRNIGGVKAILSGIGFKNISGESRGITMDNNRTPVIEIVFKWD